MYTSEKNTDHSVIAPHVAVAPQDNFFLFICDNNHSTNEYYAHFINSEVVNCYNEAKRILNNSNSLPELIVIDTPLNHIELVEFKVWLTSKDLQAIPVIYNETALENQQTIQLFRQKLVNDVVNIKKNYSRLSYKARFIRKITLREQSRNNTVNHSSRNGHDMVIRTIDIIISLFAIICFLPLFIIIGLAVKLESKGPIFYSALRAGEGFRIFKFYKFRTMIVDADKKLQELSSLNAYSGTDKQANFFKIKDDPRITKLGMFLRNSSLDELPQFFNVLKGDMSIVGNRPLPLYEATTLTTNEWAERFMAPAGITGLWQISKRGKEDISNEERILLDISYARNRSLKGDLRILIQTPTALIQKTNV